MLPAAAALRLLLPMSAIIYLIYKYLRSGNKDVVPYSELSDRDLTILKDKIGAVEPAVLDKLLKIKPAVLHDMLFGSAESDPAMVDAIRKLSLKGGKKEGEENENGNINETKSEERECDLKTGTCKFGPNCKSNHPHITTENNQNYLRSGGQRLDLYASPNPSKVDTVLQVDPAELGPAIIDVICKFSLKEKEEGEQEVEVSCSRPETEIRNKNGNKTQSEERDGGGGENKNKNGGQVEKKVDDERSRRHHYPVRPPGAGDSSHNLKTGTHKFGSNCKFNRTLRSKNNQVSKDKMKEREGFAEKPGQTECKNDFRSGGRHPNLHATPNPGDPDLENGNGNKTQNEERDKERSRIHHSVRFEAGDCWSYLKTGTCKLWPNCKFNHPPRRKNNQNYLRSGGCKPRNAFSFNPRRGEPSVAPVQELNFMDLPIRPGEKECYYYMKYGFCKSETNCKFNHPDPTAIGESAPPSGYIDGGPASVQGASSSTAWDYLCVPMIPPSQGIPSENTEWNGSQDPEYLPEKSIPAPPPYVMNNAVTETNIYEQNPQPKQVEEFPERPGQPVCIYFSRKGDCKHGSNCEYHHPKYQTAVPPPCALSDKGLPLRPGQKICTQYSSYGICNSGPGCKFDHPPLSTIWE